MAPTFDSHNPNLRPISNQTLERQRDAYIDHTKDHLVQCSIEAWFNRFTIEKFQANEIRLILKTLKDYGTYDGSHWIHIHELQTDKTAFEPDIYAVLQRVANEIREAAEFVKPGLKGKANVFGSTPSDFILPLVPSPSSHPDGRWIPSEFGVTSSSVNQEKQRINTLSLLQYKKGDSVKDLQENERQLLFDVCNLLYNDPRRLFMHGISIAKSTANIWNFNRAYICMTDNFDIHKEPEVFVRFYLNQLFATPTQLGFDPSVRAIITEEGEDKGKVCWEFKVGEVTYRTIGPPLAYETSYWLLSRACRVWKVKRVVDGKLVRRPHVIKDYHPWKASLGERVIQENILQSLKRSHPDQVELLRSHFVKILSDDVVSMPDGIKGSEDGCTPPLPDRIEETTWIDIEEATSVSPSAPASAGVRDMHGGHALVKPRTGSLTLDTRAHRRVVFEELCQTMYEVTNFYDALRCFRDITIGLNLFRLAGYVHRDVSGGNCLRGLDGRGRISDLEFAQRYDRSSQHDPIAGTPQFVAVEVASGNYLWPLGGGDSKPPPQERFLPNYYHDLEAATWTYLHYSIEHVPSTAVENATPEKHQLLQKLKKIRDELFNKPAPYPNNSPRCTYISEDGPNVMLDRITSIGQHHSVVDLLLPSSANTILRDAYMKLEAEPETERNPYRWSEDRYTSAPYIAIIELIDTALKSYSKDNESPEQASAASLVIQVVGAWEKQHPEWIRPSRKRKFEK